MKIYDLLIKMVFMIICNLVIEMFVDVQFEFNLWFLWVYVKKKYNVINFLLNVKYLKWIVNQLVGMSMLVIFDIRGL